jgi:hypothetical protein
VNEKHSNGASRTISIPDPITVRDLAAALDLKFYVLVRDLMELNTFASSSTLIDFSTASFLCSRYGVVAHKII